MAIVTPIKTERTITTIQAICPKCKHEFEIEVTEVVYTANVTCVSCGYEWVYEGKLNRRVECPKCGSTKNEMNRSIFGRFEGFV